MSAGLHLSSFLYFSRKREPTTNPSSTPEERWRRRTWMRSLSPEMCTSRAPALFAHILFPVCKGKIILLFLLFFYCYCCYIFFIAILYRFFIVIVMMYFLLLYHYYYYYSVTFCIQFPLIPFDDEIDWTFHLWR